MTPKSHTQACPQCYSRGEGPFIRCEACGAECSKPDLIAYFSNSALRIIMDHTSALVLLGHVLNCRIIETESYPDKTAELRTASLNVRASLLNVLDAHLRFKLAQEPEAQATATFSSGPSMRVGRAHEPAPAACTDTVIWFEVERKTYSNTLSHFRAALKELEHLLREYEALEANDWEEVETFQLNWLLCQHLGWAAGQLVQPFTNRQTSLRFGRLVAARFNFDRGMRISF